MFQPTLPLSCQVDERLRVSADGMYRRPVWLNRSVNDEIDNNTFLCNKFAFSGLIHHLPRTRHTLPLQVADSVASCVSPVCFRRSDIPTGLRTAQKRSRSKSEITFSKYQFSGISGFFRLASSISRSATPQYPPTRVRSRFCNSRVDLVLDQTGFS